MRDADLLIDKIYEAAAVPDMWVSVIEEIAEAVGAYGGSLFSVGAVDTAIFASKNCREHLAALLSEGWNAVNFRASRLMDRPATSFYSDEDYASEDEIERHPIYRDFLRPRGLGWTAATQVVGVGSDRAIFSIDRLHSHGRFDKEQIDFLNSLRPHLSRSVLLGRKLLDQATVGSLHALQSIGIPAAAVDSRGQVKAANAAFERMTLQVKFLASDQIELEDRKSNRLFKSAVEKLRFGYGAPMSIGVRGIDDAPPFVLHLTPVKGVGRDVFGGMDILLAVVPLSQPGMSFRALVQQLYDFTPSEAKVAEELLAGRSAAQIAEGYGLSVETVRSQTKSIYAKTGISRQPELVARFSAFCSA